MSLKRLLYGSIAPRGWLFEEATRNLKGLVGELDDLVPGIIRDDEIYGRDRLTGAVKSKDLGTVAQDQEWEVQYLWWNSESQSNWLDGLIRHAYLVGNDEYIDKAKKYLRRVLMAQDDDGYIGIYAGDLRFDFKGENGELWAQATFLRAALGYYELTGESEVLERVMKAFDLTMKAYSERNPFDLEKAYAGASHGLAFTDVCHGLFGLTGDKKYLRFAGRLVDFYNRARLSEEDIREDNLLDYAYRFKGHGVHTYEGLRSLIIASMPDGRYNRAIEAYLHRLNFVTTPSGAPIGDEWIGGRSADATETGYEFCSIQELLHSYLTLLETTGDLRWADRAEWLYYNAAHGAVNPRKSQIAYCKSDNSYAMNGHVGGMGSENDLRYKYSPVHQDVAVCCAPNAGRVLPYFTGSMYMKSRHGLLVALYGPSRVETSIDGIDIALEQITSYPFDLNIELRVTTAVRRGVTILLKKPSWVEKMKVEDNCSKVEDCVDSIAVSKDWKDDRILIEFTGRITERLDLKGDVYYSYGPLLYAMEIESAEKPGRLYGKGFEDSLFLPEDRSFLELCATEKTLESLAVSNDKHSGNFTDPPLMRGKFLDRSSGEEKTVFLKPIGSTILRKTTFQKNVRL